MQKQQQHWDDKKGLQFFASVMQKCHGVLKALDM
jgi:hypothetical protein